MAKPGDYVREGEKWVDKSEVELDLEAEKSAHAADVEAGDYNLARERFQKWALFSVALAYGLLVGYQQHKWKTDRFGSPDDYASKRTAEQLERRLDRLEAYEAGRRSATREAVA